MTYPAPTRSPARIVSGNTLTGQSENIPGVRVARIGKNSSVAEWGCGKLFRAASDRRTRRPCHATTQARRLHPIANIAGQRGHLA